MLLLTSISQTIDVNVLEILQSKHIT